MAAARQIIVDSTLPTKLRFLFQPHRYKVAYGGRGGAKSWAFAQALLIHGANQTERILCTREVQKTIADSVHRLLTEQIAALNLSHLYRVRESYIAGPRDTEFIFAGLKNTDNLKSCEGVTKCWVEEGQNVTKHSWERLVPTIRRDDSEIWVSFNPELDTDETWRRFVVSPPPDAHVVKVNWSDNPWFPEVLRNEMRYMEQTDPAAFDHVWMGNPRSAVVGAIYENEMRAADNQGRICKVPYDRSAPVHTAWDLGYGDMVSIWMIQYIGFEHRVIDYEEGTAQAISHYLQRLQTRPYVWGVDYLPWDGGAKQLGTGKSIEELLRAAGRRVQVVKRLGVVDGINAVRTIFPQTWFDLEKCEDGIRALRRYKWGEKSDGERMREPMHDAASHPADAIRTYAVGIRNDPKKPQLQLPPMVAGASWMG